MHGTYKYKVLSAGWSPLSDRFYPVDVLRELVKTFPLAGTPNLGEYLLPFESSESRAISVDRASHITLSLHLENDDTELWASVRPLKTPRGKILAGLLEKGNATLLVTMLGKMNDFNEVETTGIRYVRTIATGGK